MKVRYQFRRMAGTDRAEGAGFASPEISSDIRDAAGMRLLNIASDDWRFENRRTDLKKARASGASWDYWGQVVYFVGEADLVHISQSPYHYEDVQDFVTLKAEQLDQILIDFELFLSNGVEFEREY